MSKSDFRIHLHSTAFKLLYFGCMSYCLNMKLHMMSPSKSNIARSTMMPFCIIKVITKEQTKWYKFSKIYGSSPVWISLWLSRVCFFPNFFSHKSHENLLGSWRILRCWDRTCLCLKAALQSLHLNCRPPWSFSWDRQTSLEIKLSIAFLKSNLTAQGENFF